jgi:hypothetical protein
MSSLDWKRRIASGYPDLLAASTLENWRLEGVEIDILWELDIAGVDLAEKDTGADFCSSIDGKRGFVGAGVTRVCISASFRRATAFNLAKHISIEEQTVERDMC